MNLYILSKTAYYTIQICSLLASCCVLYLLCRVLSVRGKYIAAVSYFIISFVLCIFCDTRFYVMPAIVFLLLGVYFYIRRRYGIFVICFAAAVAMNYYSAFLLVPMIIMQPRSLPKKAVEILLGLTPVTAIYIIEHFIFPEQTVCLWLPDFQLWNLLFDKHCLDGFYWFWSAYILLLVFCGIIALKKEHPKPHITVGVAFVCYSLPLYFAEITPEFTLLFLPFVPLACGMCRSDEFIDILFEAMLFVISPLICLSSPDFSYGALGGIVRGFLNKFSQYGIYSILIAGSIIAIISIAMHIFNMSMKTEKMIENENS